MEDLTVLPVQEVILEQIRDAREDRGKMLHRLMHGNLPDQQAAELRELLEYQDEHIEVLKAAYRRRFGDSPEE